MTYHPTSAVSVAVVLAIVVIVAGYRAGRTHEAWHEVHSVKRAYLTHRRHAWTQTFQLLVGAALVLATLAAAGYLAAT